MTEANVDQRAATAPPEPAMARPSGRWWQALLATPVIAALITVSPQWGQAVRHAFLGTSAEAEARAELQAQSELATSQMFVTMISKNQDCMGAPFKWITNSENVAVDATMCESGDILVQVKTPEMRYPALRWVPVQAILENKAMMPMPIASSRGAALIASAEAATIVPPGSSTSSSGSARSQFAANASIICQYLSGRFIVRHVRTPDGCFAERIDTYSGQIVDRNPIPCNASCGA